MTFFAVLIALLLEQLHPLPGDNPARSAARDWLDSVAHNLDAGKLWHARLAWAVAVLLPGVGVALLFIAAQQLHTLLALAFDVGVLYATLGFRSFSHHYTRIRDALMEGRDDDARAALAAWKRVDASELPRAELLRQVMEHATLAAHRHVFGVFFWFVVLSAAGLGPAGAVLYRVADAANRRWNRSPSNGPVTAAAAAHTLSSVGSSLALQRVARGAFRVIDHVPARLTAAGFAVVGNFEEAVDAWRRHAEAWAERNDGVVVAAATGAVGLPLGGPRNGSAALSPPLALPDAGGADPQVAHLHSLVALVWRAVVLWMLLLALLTLANVLG